jgi:hypothetical protein
MPFGFALRWMARFIVGCRLHFPGKRVLVGKANMKTAYRRAHLQLATAVECVDQLDGLLFLMMRFPFGGKPCPVQWRTISEPICDLANELINEFVWSPANLRSCYMTWSFQRRIALTLTRNSRRHYPLHSAYQRMQWMPLIATSTTSARSVLTSTKTEKCVLQQ